jgi:hypothetical protein
MKGSFRQETLKSGGIIAVAGEQAIQIEDLAGTTRRVSTLLIWPHVLGLRIHFAKIAEAELVADRTHTGQIGVKIRG